MNESVLLARHLTLSDLTLEVLTGVDGQGAPTYDTPVAIQARAVRENKVVDGPDGTRIMTDLMLYVPGTEAVLPNSQDRVGLGTETFIVVVTKDINDSSATCVARRVRCRRE